MAYMVNKAGQRICHRGHRMTRDTIYVEHRKDGSIREHCVVCRKEAGERFRCQNPGYHKKYNSGWRKRNEKHRNTYEANARSLYRKQWIKYFKQIYGHQPHCRLCNKRLYWTHKEHGKRVCFDHRTGVEPIRAKSPRTWTQNKPCTEDNQAVFRECNFGILCRACNLLLPSDISKRKKMIDNLVPYLQEGLQ